MKKYCLLLFSLLLFSCNSLDFFQKKEAENVISLHALTSDRLNLRVVKEVEISETESRKIKVHPLLHNINIVAAKPFQMHGGHFGLLLKLDDVGQRRWYAASGSFAGMPMCLCVDGEYRTIVHFERFNNREIVKLYCKLSEEEARAISKPVKQNYRTLNDL